MSIAAAGTNNSCIAVFSVPSIPEDESGATNTWLDAAWKIAVTVIGGLIPALVTAYVVKRSCPAEPTQPIPTPVQAAAQYQ